MEEHGGGGRKPWKAEKGMPKPHRFSLANEFNLARPVAESPPLTKKELWGWYIYDCACQAFSTVVVPIFFPLLLVSLAQSEVWVRLKQDEPQECSATVKTDCMQCRPGKGRTLVTGERWPEVPDMSLHIGSARMHPVSFATVVLGISVLFQILVFITFGPLADYGSKRKHGLILATVLGSTATMTALCLTHASQWWLSGLLLIVANVAFGMSSVFYNAFLPVLVDATTSVRDAVAFLPVFQAHLVRERVENEYSQKGLGLGNISAVVYTLACIFIAVAPLDNLTVLRTAIFLGGLWWLIGSIPTLFLLLPRPGPPLPNGLVITEGWRHLLETVRDARKYKYTFRFLVCYFVYSDGYSTIANWAILFGQRDLCMTTIELVGWSMLVAFLSAFGNWMFLYIQRNLLLESKTMLVILLGLMSLLPLYGMLGFVLPLGSIGLFHSWEMLIWGGFFGVCVGAVQSYSRTLFAELIPKGKEAAMFSLYSITDKGSSWTGPLVISASVQATGNMRLSLIYILLVILIPIFFLHFHIDHKKAMIEAGRATKVAVVADESMVPNGDPLDDRDDRALIMAAVDAGDVELSDTTTISPTAA